MLNRLINNSKIIIGITYTKYNSSLSSYIRFLAKHNKLKYKKITRIEKILMSNNLLSNIFRGPIHIFYSDMYETIKFLNDIQQINDFSVVFIKYNDTIILSNTFNLKKSDKEYCLDSLSSLNVILSKINLNVVNFQLISLIYAYSQSVIKRN